MEGDHPGPSRICHTLVLEQDRNPPLRKSEAVFAAGFLFPLADRRPA